MGFIHPKLAESPCIPIHCYLWKIPLSTLILLGSGKGRPVFLSRDTYAPFLAPSSTHVLESMLYSAR